MEVTEVEEEEEPLGGRDMTPLTKQTLLWNRFRKNLAGAPPLSPPEMLIGLLSDHLQDITAVSSSKNI